MDELKHYGTPTFSGRYPWGSGGNVEQRNTSFLGLCSELSKAGMSQVDIAKGFGMTTTQLRAEKSLESARERKEKYSMALKLKDKGMSTVAIGKRMGINESSVRSLLDPATQARSEITKSTAEMLKKSVAEKKYIDIGVGVEHTIGVTRNKLKTAVAQCEAEGYEKHSIPVVQVGTGKTTQVLVLAPPGTTWGEVARNKKDIKTIENYTEDGGRSYLGIKPVESVSSKRVMVNYSETGGTNKDGVIELRRGVEDLSLGEARYAQVRISVDGTHFLKGMAMYADDLPDGVDIRFNTNKSKAKIGDDIHEALKPYTDDADNPFGAIVRQKEYVDAKGETRVSALNVINEEGDWNTWSKSLSAQMLSKQPTSLAKKQLDLSYDIREEEFNEIMALTNPAVKRKLLEGFADNTEVSAAQIKAAALPRQSNKVILPLPDIKEGEIYAPTYNNGERVVLVRYPHGGKFEIPELVVNNKNPQAQKVMDRAKDAVGLHPKVAERLSGADFDGDTVIVIPNNNKFVKTSAALKDLKDFDPKISYPQYDGMEVISIRAKNAKMGDVSNLITDMTIKGADDKELARAVKYSMVVIDANKHKLNHELARKECGIAGLKQKYQGGANRGASTLISKSNAVVRVDVRKESINPKTGEKIYNYTPTYKNKDTGEIVKVSTSYVNKKGATVNKTMKSRRMLEVDDAFELSSGTQIEAVYAKYANKTKALANTARKEMLATKPIAMSASAKKVYEKEVDSLNAKLKVAIRNKPRERQAQLIANQVIKTKIQNNPDMEDSEKKKKKSQALTEARRRVGAKKISVDITPKEWDAIQAGAVSNTVLNSIMNNTNMDVIKKLATPRTAPVMTAAKQLKAKNYLSRGYTQAEIAKALGVSQSTVSKVLG